MARPRFSRLPGLKWGTVLLLSLVFLGGLTWYLVEIAEKKVLVRRLESIPAYRTWLDSCRTWISLDPAKRGMWVGRVTREIRMVPDQNTSPLLAVEMQHTRLLHGDMKSPGEVLYVSLRESVHEGDRIPVIGETWCMVVEWKDDRSIAFALVPYP